MDALQDILRRIETTLDGTLRYFASDLHGREHLREVALLAGRIARRSGVDVETAMVAGYLHDCGRVDDAAGNAHAHESAAIARRVLPERFPHLPAEAIAAAIERHADGEVTDDPLAGALWDADRLTLPRAGFVVDENLLSTDPGRRMLREESP